MTRAIAPQSVEPVMQSGDRRGWRAPLSRWASEPFVHFLLLGAGLFGAYELTQTRHAPLKDRQQMVLERGDVEHLRSGFAAQWRRPPSDSEMQALVDDRLDEEILYREALALGLDRDDTVVRRRLAQKTAFLLQDVASLREPSAEELAAYRSHHALRYVQSPRWSFEHIYFSSASRRDKAERDAVRVLETLSSASARFDVETLGDASLLESHQHDQSETQLRELFGPDFASSIATASAGPVGEWTGPFRSSYGWHLVRLQARADVPRENTGELEGRLRADWGEDQRRALNAQTMARLRARYNIVVNTSSTP
ncbi:MAG: peptidyl-prolyl cis-trans isomerase [Variovorax sp.]|nr:MAG: peptidyl-prolyl cis-trans isomerase [Variovorax sp.]